MAVLAIDPSSPVTGGAILGDRIRMNDYAGDPDVFIRSMASRGHLGGLAGTTAESAAVLDACGFGLVFIETVGTGQSEVEVASIADTTVVVQAPEMGDEIQALKAGLLEVADLVVVNTCGFIEAAVDEIIAANPAQVEKARQNPKLAGWFVGQVMKATGGKANPKAVNEIVAAKLIQSTGAPATVETTTDRASAADNAANGTSPMRRAPSESAASESAPASASPVQRLSSPSATSRGPSSLSDRGGGLISHQRTGKAGVRPNPAGSAAGPDRRPAR